MYGILNFSSNAYWGTGNYLFQTIETRNYSENNTLVEAKEEEQLARLGLVAYSHLHFKYIIPYCSWNEEYEYD